MSEIDILHRLLSSKAGAVMLDVGAHHGESLLPFARDGWDVHAFEPDPDNRTRLEQVCSGLPNVSIVAEAVSDEPGTRTLYSSDESSGISSLAAFSSSHRARATVVVTTLAAYVQEAGLEEVSLLKIDAEGYDRFVLRGYPWEHLRPRAILCEFEDAKTVPLGYSWSDLASDLVQYGYEVIVSEWRPVRAYGTPHEWHRFAPYPADLEESAAWGNLLAVSAADLDRVSVLLRRSAARFAVRRRVDRFRRVRG